MIGAVALVAAAAFGAGDQYLGSLSSHPWLADLSLLSAPWLLLAFLAGCTQRTPRRAAWLGLLCTYAALCGYGLMTLSPLENAHLSTATAAAFVRSEAPVMVGGVMTGPLFGWLGYRWRSGRLWWAAIAAAGAMCLEPAARLAADQPIRSSHVLLSEVSAGVALLVYFSVRWAAYHGGRPSV